MDRADICSPWHLPSAELHTNPADLRSSLLLSRERQGQDRSSPLKHSSLQMRCSRPESSDLLPHKWSEGDNVQRTSREFKSL